MNKSNLEKEINKLWNNKNKLGASSSKKLVKPILDTIEMIDRGKIRVAEKKSKNWTVNEWVKKAILLSFIINKQKVIANGPGKSFWWDKVP